MGSRGHRDDERRLRRHRRHPANARQPGRRGPLPLAAVVLLRDPHPRGRRRAGARQAGAAGVRPRRGPHRGGHRAAHPDACWSTARTTRPAESTRRETLRRWPGPHRCLRAHRPPDLDPVGRAVQPNRVRWPHGAQRGRVVPAHGRSRTRTASSCWRRACASATWPCRRPARSASLRDDVFVQQIAAGYAFPNALLQHSIADLERLSIDIGALERRRDRLVPALREMGYDASMPEGTFYTMARSPIADDVAFAGTLARHKVLVLPGTSSRPPAGSASASPRRTRWSTRASRASPPPARRPAGSLSHSPAAARGHRGGGRARTRSPPPHRRDAA